MDILFQQADLQTLLANPRTEARITSRIKDSQLFQPDSMPDSLRQVYARCFAPPNLAKMDPFMDPGQGACLELYTNPNFFLKEWILEQDKLRQAAKEERRKRREEAKAKRDKDKQASGKQLGEAKPKKIQQYYFDPETGQKVLIRSQDEPAAAPASTARGTPTPQAASPQQQQTQQSQQSMAHSQSPAAAAHHLPPPSHPQQHTPQQQQPRRDPAQTPQGSLRPGTGPAGNYITFFSFSFS
jgi:hypothetical protein